MRHRLKIFISFISIFVLSAPAITSATPTQYGDSGLVSVPTTEIAERAVFHTAIWLNQSQKNDGFTIVPLSLSMGLMDALEVSGSYPNILLNNQNDGSLRGFENIGLKYRLLGQANSNFKAAISAFLRQTVSKDETVNGLRDLGSRLLVSYKMSKAEINLNAGYLKVGSPKSVEYEDEVLFGGAVEYLLSDRLKTFLEFDGNTGRANGRSRMELAPGLQYYLLSNLSFIGTAGAGFTDAGPDYRIVAGVTFSSGAGGYVKAIPVIPGSREKYAEAQSSSSEELVPDLPVPSKEAEIKPIAAPVPAAAAAPPPPPPPPPPAPVTPPAPPVEKIEAIIPGTKKPVEITVEKDRIVVHGDVLFAPGKSELTGSGKVVIARVAERMKEIKGLKGIKLEGHTDNVGKDLANEKLSLKRAQAVKDQLVKSGISDSMISVQGYGKTRPIAPNNTPAGREKNRRVDILLVVSEQ